MNLNNENQKRRPSDSSGIGEQSELKAPFCSVKAFVVSTSQKNENIENNDIIRKSNNQKLLIKLQDSPKKQSLFSYDRNMEEQSKSINSSEVFENSNLSSDSFDKRLVSFDSLTLLHRFFFKCNVNQSPKFRI